MLRNYFLGEIQVAGEETIRFHLIFTVFGSMYVEETRETYTPSFTRSASRVPVEELDAQAVSGKTLRQLLEAKLSEILPPSF